MTITLSAELEQIIAVKVASGDFESAEDVVATGLGLLNNLDYEQRTRLKWLREQIAIGIAEVARGACAEVDVNEIKAEARRRFQAK